MSLRLFTAPTGVAALHEFDDAALGTDLGEAFSTLVDGHPVEVAASGDAKLREIVQWVSLTSDATVRLTPIADDVPMSEQAYTAALLVSEGTSQRIEVPCSVRGRRFAVLIEVLSGLATALGEAELWIIPKRTSTGGTRP
jgi:hypothetical protein